ncbi:MAG: cytochrome c [Bacteroidetes bacterium]|nr:cytochrome c [Bacteroidota bacterium]
MQKILKRAMFSVSFLSLFVLFVAATINENGFGGGDDWKAPASVKTLENPLAKFKGNAKITNLGKSLYTQQCATCHGDSGLGDGSSARYLQKYPRNLTTSEFQSQTDGEIFWKIVNGNSPMPTFKDILTEKQMWIVVNYLRTLASK